MRPLSSIDAAQRFAQEALALAPTIILGSGASAAHNVPGMGVLGAHLCSLPVPTAWATSQTDEWSRFGSLIARGVDLESALGDVKFSHEQTDFVVQHTRSFILDYDRAVFLRVLKNKRELPLTRLYQHLFSSTHRTVNVVTPNYDRLAEYAADAAQLNHFTGFSSGYIQHRAQNAPRSANDAQKTVCIWKVHGSLDWFRTSQNEIVGLRHCSDIPAGFQPLMVTPGIDKYRITHGEPFRTIFACSDAALERARAYICVGYGFNDSHVQEKLVNRCEAESIPLLVVTHGLTDTTKTFLESGRCRKYMAIEACSGGALVRTHDAPMGFTVTNPIWSLGDFLDFCLGD